MSHLKGHIYSSPPLSLVYGAKATTPIEVMVHSTQFTLANKLLSSHVQISHIEGLEERRHKVENKWLSCQKQISTAYNKQVRPRSLSIF